MSQDIKMEECAAQGCGPCRSRLIGSQVIACGAETGAKAKIRYFDYATRGDGRNGWGNIECISFRPYGEGTIHYWDGTTKTTDGMSLNDALEAAARGTWIEIHPTPSTELRLLNAQCADELLREGAAPCTPDPTDTDTDDEQDYLVTATVQVVVRAQHRVEARILTADLLREFIACSPYEEDPMNGVIVESVENVTDPED